MTLRALFYPSFSSYHYFRGPFWCLLGPLSSQLPQRPSQLPPRPSELSDALRTPSKALLAPCDQRPSQLLPIQGLPSSHQSPPAPSDPKPSQLPPCPYQLSKGFLITLVALPAPSEAFVALVVAVIVHHITRLLRFIDVINKGGGKETWSLIPFQSAIADPECNRPLCLCVSLSLSLAKIRRPEVLRHIAL